MPQPWWLVAAVFIGCATWLALRPLPDGRVRRIIGPRRRSTHQPRAPLWAALTAAIGTAVVLPIPWGILVAVVVFIVVGRALARLTDRGNQRERDQLARQVPIAADLLAATVASGASVLSSVRAVGTSVDEPMKSRLHQVEAALVLGADAREAWRSWQDEPPLRPMAVAIARSMQTGASLSSVLARLSDDCRREHTMRIEVAARSAGVRAVAPLAACFLPAFVVLGVVPVVASLAVGILG